MGGVFAAILEFSCNDSPKTLNKIVYINVKKEDLGCFNNIFKNIKSKISEGEKRKLPEIEVVQTDSIFKTRHYFKQGYKKIGLTIAPNGNHQFLGETLGKGRVLKS